MNYPTQSLQIHVHKVDGSLETFTQNEDSLANCILNEFHPTRIFTREKIIFAGNRSLTSFPVRQIVRIDLVSEQMSHLILPSGIVEAVELTETEFRALLQNPELHDQWDQAQAQEASVVAFLDVEMAGQLPLFLALELPLEPLADQPEAILFPLYPLTVPALCFRMRTGGIAALNLLHLVQFTLFHGPQPAPVEAWPAHRAKNPQLKHPDWDFRKPAVRRPLPSPFPPNGQMNLDPSQRSQNENESKMEGKH